MVLPDNLLQFDNVWMIQFTETLQRIISDVS